MADSQPRLVPERTALLVMDIQNRIVANYPDPTILTRLRKAIATARKAKIKIVYVSVAIRKGNPDISLRNQTFSNPGLVKGFADTNPGSAIHPAVKPKRDDALIAKRRVSAFAGSDLDLVLRANDIDTLVLTGIATSGVVLSTLRQAADLDYRCQVLSDGCADSDEEVHRVLLTKVFPRQAKVLTVAEWVGLVAPKAKAKAAPKAKTKTGGKKI